MVEGQCNCIEQDGKGEEIVKEPRSDYDSKHSSETFPDIVSTIDWPNSNIVQMLDNFG